MNALYSLVTCLFLAWGAFRFGTTYGSRWGFGSYGMPVTLLAEDGVHYLDGTIVPPPILSLAKSGMEAPLELALVVIMTPLLIALVRVYCQLIRSQRNLQRLRDLDHSLRR